MDNRGLQVGDTFDARQVLRNLRAQRANAGPVATTMPTSRVGVQRGGRDVNRFQSLNQQRSLANNQAAANVNPTGGLRGAGPMNKITPTAPAPAANNQAAAKPKYLKPGNIDQYMN